MNRVLNERRDDIAAAMRGLCDAVGRLSLVRDQLVQEMQTLPPGHENERVALDLQRTCDHLATAAGYVPDECWQIMISDREVGGHEVRERVKGLIHIYHGNSICSRAIRAEQFGRVFSHV